MSVCDSGQWLSSGRPRRAAAEARPVPGGRRPDHEDRAHVREDRADEGVRVLHLRAGRLTRAGATMFRGRGASGSERERRKGATSFVG